MVWGLIKSRIAAAKDDTTMDKTKGRASGYALRYFTRVLAFRAKVLVDVNMKMGGDTDIVIEGLRGVVALRKYAQDACNPIVIHDLGSLEALIYKKGFEEGASYLQQEALRRLESYVEYIPIYPHKENHGLSRRGLYSAGRKIS
jgi:hypothetical protein